MQGTCVSRRVARIGATLACALTVALGGCRAFTVDPEPEPEPEPTTEPRMVQLAGSWSGTLQVEGQRIPGTLVLRQRDERLDASFAAVELGGETTGSGAIGDEGSVRLELRYRTQCPGTVALEGVILNDAARLAGSLTATDCTGIAEGTFSFTRDS